MSTSSARERRWLGSLSPVLIAACVATAVPLLAHDIPKDVVIQIFVQPEGQRLRVLVRAPLAAMRDVQFPTRGDNFLDIARAEPALRHAASLWLADGIGMYEGRAKLGAPRIEATQVSLPSDRSFTTYEAALAHVTGSGLADDTMLVWNQALMDVLFEYAIRSDRSELSIEPALARLGMNVVTVVRFTTPTGAVRAFELRGDPGIVRLDPRWHQAAIRFVQLGFFHILDGTDHLLFLLCLVLPFRRLRPLVLIVTAFTIAHSTTLIASAFDLAPTGLWFPPLIETLIAASIVFMALENVVNSASGPDARSSVDDRVRVRSRPRVRLLVRTEGDAAVRRQPCADIARDVQRRRRAGPARRAARADSRVVLRVPPCRRGARGDHRRVGDRRAHGVALDDRAVANAVAVRLARDGCGGDGGRGAMADAAGDGRRNPVAGVARHARQGDGRSDYRPAIGRRAVANRGYGLTIFS
jgi:hypothetical protein